MPSDDERGLRSGSRSTDTASRGLPAQLAEQASRRRAAYPLVGPAEADAARAAARRLREGAPTSGEAPPGAAGDAFHYVARHSFTAPTESLSRAPVLTQKQANDFLTLVRTPVTQNEDFLRPARAEVARHARSSREKLPKNASQAELFAYLWRLKYLNIRPPDPEEDPAAAQRFDDPGETSLVGALRALKTNTVGIARARGMPLAESWPDELPLSDPKVTTTVVYVGPGFAGVFDTAGRLKPTPFGWIWRVSAAPKLADYTLGDYCIGGIFFSVKVDLGARGIQEWVLPMHPAGSAFRVGDFGIDLVEITRSQRETLRDWNLKANHGMVFVLSPSYWKRKSIGAAVTEAPYRLWAAASRCVEEGYIWDALGEQLGELGPAQVARMIFEMILARLGIPTPDALDGAGRLGRAIGMAVWGDTNEAADIDAAARILAPEAASMLIGLGVGIGATKVAGAALRLRKAGKVKDTSPSPALEETGARPAQSDPSLPPPGTPAVPPRNVRTAGDLAGEVEGTAGAGQGRHRAAGERGVEGSRPNDTNRGLADEPAAVQRTGSSTPAALGLLKEALSVLRRHRLLVPAEAILKGAIEFGRTRIKILSEWFDGTVLYYKMVYYFALDGVKNQVIKIGRAIDEWADEPILRLDMSLLGVNALDALGKLICRAVRNRLRKGITPEEMLYLEQLDAASWQRVMRYAEGRQGIHSIKGKLAEELIKLTPEFRAAMDRARQAAAQEGFSPDTLRFIPNLKGKTLTEQGRLGTGELTDGVIAVVENIGPDVPPIVRVYAVFESKSPSNARELGRGRGGGIGQPGKDMERFSELPIVIDGVQVPPDNVGISRHFTEWLVMTPPGTRLKPIEARWLQAGFPKVQAFHTPIRNHVLYKVAATIAYLVRSGELPLVTGRLNLGPSWIPHARQDPGKAETDEE